jgi:hypothetical protein
VLVVGARGAVRRLSPAADIGDGISLVISWCLLAVGVKPQAVE